MIIWAKIERLFGDGEEGGLSVRSLRTKNSAFLGKWKWRWLKEKDSLWVRVVDSINGGVGGTLPLGCGSQGWSVRNDIRKPEGK